MERLQLWSLDAHADGSGSDGKNTGIPSPSIATSLPGDLKDPGGIRKAFSERGVTFKLNYTGELWVASVAELTGGIL